MMDGELSPEELEVFRKYLNAPSVFVEERVCDTCLFHWKPDMCEKIGLNVIKISVCHGWVSKDEYGRYVREKDVAPGRDITWARWTRVFE